MSGEAVKEQKKRQQQQPVVEEEEEKKYPVKASATFGAGSFLTALPIIELGLHGGVAGLIIAGCIGYASWRHGPQLYELLQKEVGDFIPLPDLWGASEDETLDEAHEQGQEQAPEHRPSGKMRRSWLDRATGYFPPGYFDDEESDQGQRADSGPEEQAAFYETHFHLGPALQPHANEVLSHRIDILGIPGSGKSNLVADLVEELADKDAPLILLDQKPEYGKMVDFFPHGIAAGAHNLTLENAFVFGQQIVRDRLQVVVNLQSYGDDNVAAWVMIKLIKGVLTWQQQFTDEDRVSTTVVLDEAHYWLPEDQSLSTISRQKDKNGRTLNGCFRQTFFSLISGGRSLGVGTILSTQRPASIAKQAIAIADWRFFLKATDETELKVYRHHGCSNEVAMSLVPGKAFVVAPDNSKGVYQLRRRYTPDDSKTPGLSALKKDPAIYKNRPLVNETSVSSPRASVSTSQNRSETFLNGHETASEALQGNIIKGMFPVSETPDETEVPSVKDTPQPVSDETIAIIKAMKSIPGATDRQISSYVKLGGGRYEIYKQVLRQLGYTKTAEEG